MATPKQVLFASSHGITATPAKGFKQLHRRLRNSYKIETSANGFLGGALGDADVVVLGGPREKFSVSEFDALKAYVEEGGSVLLLMGEGGEPGFNKKNVNYLLEEFGMMVNEDAVVRTVYYKYLHPKEVYVSTGVLNREINRAAGKTALAKTVSAGGDPAQSVDADREAAPESLAFVYPYGSTMNVQKPAVPILSSGYIAYPLNRPVGAMCERGKGRLCVLGSVQIFDDAWLQKEDNGKLADVIFKWLARAPEVELDTIDASDPGDSEFHHVPDTEALAERLRSGLEESDELPRDFTELFDDRLFKFDTNLIPDAIRLYEKLRVKHAPLSLIPPQFETPLPPLQPAVFPPNLREPPPPALDLFDLDEEFAGERVRLAQVTNKCQSDDDLEYYVRECGTILDVAPGGSAKQVLEHILKEIAAFKKSGAAF